jgi:predicted O-linked N-acetylglucosamine transferase (SPINDLY family)
VTIAPVRSDARSSGISLPTIADPPKAEAEILAQIADALDAHEQGRTWEAEKRYRQVLKKHPDHPRARALLALLVAQKKVSADAKARAVREMGEAAARDLNDVLVQTNWGAVLYGLERQREAIEAYERAIEAYPAYGAAYASLGRMLMDVCEHERAHYAYQRAIALEPENQDHYADNIFITDLMPEATFEDSLAARRRYNDVLVLPRFAEALPHINDLDPDRKLRIGYASADMYQHSGAMAWGGFVVNHDRSKFHVTLYSGTQKTDAMTEKFKASCDQWYDIRLWSDDKLAVQVYKDQIDILVDLASFTSGGRPLAFARKPAPIQISGWGYATSTGLDCMDYFATDAIVCPVDQEGRYVEWPWRLPSALSWVAPSDVLPVGHLRAAMGRPFTFGVFNRMPKITQRSIRAWVRILSRVPGSRLLVKNSQLQDEQVRDLVRAHFVAAGAEIEGSSLLVPTGGAPARIGLEGSSNHYDHLATHWIPDVMLDAYPQGGGVSSFESLWMGVPVLTILGDRPSGRITASLLHQVGLDDWAVPDEASYIERAVELSRDPMALVPIRESLRERVLAMPALRLKEYTASIEKGYREMWRRYTRAMANESSAS